MKKLGCFYILLLLFSYLTARTITVAADGSQQLSSIQTAIQCAINGDSILVYPGEYFEQLNFFGKEIYVSSLYNISGDPQDIKDCIINGNELSSVVRFSSGESRNSILSGFTITGGSGYKPSDKSYGGGIYITNSSPTIANCIIEDNYADRGGGIYVTGDINTYPIFLDLVIRRNNGRVAIGGVYIYSSAGAEFSPQQRCSIYNNYASIRSDFFHLAGLTNDPFKPISVYLDTVTVAQPQEGHIVFTHDKYILVSTP